MRGFDAYCGAFYDAPSGFKSGVFTLLHGANIWTSTDGLFWPNPLRPARLSDGRTDGTLVSVREGRGTSRVPGGGPRIVVWVKTATPVVAHWRAIRGIQMRAAAPGVSIGTLAAETRLTADQAFPVISDALSRFGGEIDAEYARQVGDFERLRGAAGGQSLCDTIDIHMLTSRDGLHWDVGWVYAREPLVPRPVQGATAGGLNFPCGPLLYARGRNATDNATTHCMCTPSKGLQPPPYSQYYAYVNSTHYARKGIPRRDPRSVSAHVARWPMHAMVGVQPRGTGGSGFGSDDGVGRLRSKPFALGAEAAAVGRTVYLSLLVEPAGSDMPGRASATGLMPTVRATVSLAPIAERLGARLAQHTFERLLPTPAAEVEPTLEASRPCTLHLALEARRGGAYDVVRACLRSCLRSRLSRAGHARSSASLLLESYSPVAHTFIEQADNW
ncbi:hypothetical protein T492DRAFT_848678 [Pavlovales sp. CCMP2436]|nr:hypothetical protein T492DRAFT_848678 [Pavlovales sp. CCMP2436]